MLLRLTQHDEGDNRHRVEVLLEGTGAPLTAEARFTFDLTTQDEEDLRWYLEDFLQFPQEPAPTIAKRVERRIDELGKELFQKVFDGEQAAGLWAQVQPHLRQTRVEIVTGVAAAVAVVREWECPGAGDRPEGIFCQEETARVFAAILPLVEREPLFHLAETPEGEAGFAVTAVYGEQGPCTVGWLRRSEPELIAALHLAEALVRRPASLAVLLVPKGRATVVCDVATVRRGVSIVVCGDAIVPHGDPIVRRGVPSVPCGDASVRSGLLAVAGGFSTDAGHFSSVAGGFLSVAGHFLNDAGGFSNDASHFLSVARGLLNDAGHFLSDAREFSSVARHFSAVEKTRGTSASPRATRRVPARPITPPNGRHRAGLRGLRRPAQGPSGRAGSRRQRHRRQRRRSLSSPPGCRSSSRTRARRARRPRPRAPGPSRGARGSAARS